jgi:hypothetical protein
MKTAMTCLLLTALGASSSALTKRMSYNIRSAPNELRLQATYSFSGNDIDRPYDKYQFENAVSVHKIRARYSCDRCGVVLVAIQDFTGKPICAPLVMNGTTGTVEANFSVNGRKISGLQVAVESLDEKPGAQLNLLLEATSETQAR